MPAAVYRPAVLPAFRDFGRQMVVAAPDTDAVAGSVIGCRHAVQQPGLLLTAEHPYRDRAVLAVPEFQRFANIHAEALEDNARARCRCREYLGHGHGENLRHNRAVRVAGRVNAGAVDGVLRAHSVKQRTEEYQLVRTVRRLAHEVPRRKRYIVRTGGYGRCIHRARRCGRVYEDKAVLVCYLVPLRVAAVDLCRAGVAVHGKYQRNRLSRILLDLLRHINVPFAHPAADLLIMVLHTEVGNRVLGDAQVTARAAHPAALPIEEILPDAAQQQICVVRRAAGNRARANAERLFFLIGRIRRLCGAHICYRIRCGLHTVLGDTAAVLPVVRGAVVCADRAFRIVNHPCRHRDIALFEVQTVAFIHKAVQIGAVVICRSLAIVLRHLGAADGRCTCPDCRIEHGCHVGDHAAFTGAGEIELRFMHAELEALRTGKIHLLHIGNVAVCLAVRLLSIPRAVLRLEEKYDQLFLGLLGVRDHAPPAVPPQVIGGLAVLRQNEHTGRRRTRVLRDIHQITAFFSANRYFFLKCTLIERLERVFRVYFILPVLIHCCFLSLCGVACFSLPA